jgi:predicted nucleic acid-binding protein
MTLADTSVWVEHFRRGHAGLRKLLEEGQIVMHPLVYGELACGHLPDRIRTLSLLAALPSLTLADDSAVLYAIDLRKWSGRGIGWIDAHLLTSALLTRTPLWTLDRKLRDLASEAGAAWTRGGLH